MIFLNGLEKLFDPKSIAVIGASNVPYSVGNSLMKSLIASGYSGTVFPINPKRRNVLGIHCYKSIQHVPEKVDLAIIAVPSFLVPKIAKQCVKAEVKSLIVVSAGFSEIGIEGIKLENELTKIISKSGIRMLGPNCLGYIRTDKKINASFAIRNALPGKLALISQSGALCSGILDWALKQKVGFKYFISVGGMLDINFSDLIEFFDQDPEIEGIAIYMESLKDAEKFMRVGKKFSKKKPIIVAKSGRFEESAKAAISHTGAMAGNDAVFGAAFKRAGIIRIKNIRELLGCAEALSKQRLPQGNRLAIITNAGGPGVMTVDALVANKCRLAKISKKGLEKLDKKMSKYWSKSNPIDLLGDASPELYAKALDVVLKEKNVDGVIVILSPQAISKPLEVAHALVDKIKRSRKTILTCWLGEDFVEEGRKYLREKGVPAYYTPEEAVRVFSYMNAYRENLENVFEEIPPHQIVSKKEKERIKKQIHEYIANGKFLLTEIEAKEILKKYGIPANKTVFAKNLKEALEKAKQIGYPVVLKVVSAAITHKTDSKAVALNLETEKDLEKAFKEIYKNAKKKNPKARIKGVSVQKMIQASELELIVGSKKDNIFGPIMLFGLGGIATEVFKDTSLELPPINKNLARKMINRTKVSRLLKGYRKKFKIKMPELEKILVNFSQFLLDFPEIEEVDINPIIISKGKLFAVDARIVLAE